MTRVNDFLKTDLLNIAVSSDEKMDKMLRLYKMLAVNYDLRQEYIYLDIIAPKPNPTGIPQTIGTNFEIGIPNLTTFTRNLNVPNENLAYELTLMSAVINTSKDVAPVKLQPLRIRFPQLNNQAFSFSTLGDLDKTTNMSIISRCPFPSDRLVIELGHISVSSQTKSELYDYNSTVNITDSGGQTWGLFFAQNADHIVLQFKLTVKHVF